MNKQFEIAALTSGNTFAPNATEQQFAWTGMYKIRGGIVTTETKLFIVSPNISGSSVSNLFHVPLLAA